MYEGEELSVVERPPVGSKAVAKAKENLLGSVNFKELVEDLVTVGKFVRIAYNGVAGDVDLQVAIKKIGFEVAELCDDSGITIGKFRVASNGVLTDLTGAYEFFLDGMEEMALTCMESVGETAEKMAKEADDLCDRFKKERDTVKEQLYITMAKKGVEAAELEKMKQEEARLEAEQSKQEELRKQAAQQERKLQSEIESSSTQENSQINSLAPNAADVILGIFTVGIAPVVRFAATAYAIKKTSEKIKRLRQDQKAEAQRRREALQQISQYATDIAKCGKEQKVQGEAIQALHGAVGALNRLVIIMQNTATFWKMMQVHCQTLADGRLLALLEKAQQYDDPNKRQKVYENSSTKKRAIELYAGWVAVESVCTEYIKEIQGSRQELHRYMSENPTVEESKRRIPIMVQEFKLQIQQADDEIKQKLEKMEKEEKEEEKLAEAKKQ